MSDSAALATAYEDEVGHDLTSGYLEALALIERLHRLLLDVIKDEFERLGRFEINAVQALLLFNIGHRVMTAGELKSRFTAHGVDECPGGRPAHQRIRRNRATKSNLASVEFEDSFRQAGFSLR